MIRQFDVCPNPIRTGRADRPYLVVLQHDHIGHLHSRIVAPLVSANVASPSRMTPELVVLDRHLFLLPTEIVTLSARYLREPVANLDDYQREIFDAIDMVFVGF